MRRIEWTPPARDDLAAIDEYWWANNPVRADEVLDRIEAAGTFLADMPLAGPQLDEGPARKWRVRGTSYLLLYRVSDEMIEILRVYHGRENWLDPA